MKILHISAGIGRSNGVMSMILNYACQMPRDICFDVMYFAETADDREDELESLGGKTIRIVPPGLHSFWRDDVDAFLEQRRGEYEAIHIHLPYLVGLMTPKARRVGIHKVYAHCHSTWFSLESGNKLRNRLFNLPTKMLADRLFACGRDAGIFWYGKKTMEKGRVTVLPNAVVCDRYRYTPERRRLARESLNMEDRLVVGHIGRVSPPQKNHPFLLRVFSELVALRPDAVLLLVGASPSEELKNLSRELGIQDSVLWLGMRSDIPELLQAMDVFVFPSFYEGLPVAVVEAQSAGLPVLMSAAVTDEVCVTGERIVRLPLESAPRLWAKRALELAELPRTDSADQVVEAGFDLSSSAARLAEIYRI